MAQKSILIYGEVEKHKGICKKLADMAYFRNFTIDAFSIDWSSEIGFAPEFLYENGVCVEE